MSFTADASRWSDVWLAATARGITICGDFLAATALALALQGCRRRWLAVSGLLLAATLPRWCSPRSPAGSPTGWTAAPCWSTVGLAQAVDLRAARPRRAPGPAVGLVALLACGLAVTQPCLAALLPAMVRPADLPRASAISQTAVSLGALGGPVLAGLLVGQFGTRVPLLLDGATYLALVVAGLLLRTRRGGRPDRRRGDPDRRAGKPTRTDRPERYGGALAVAPRPADARHGGRAPPWLSRRSAAST